MKAALVVSLIVIIVFLAIYLALPDLKLSLISALIAMLASAIFLGRIWQKIKYGTKPSRTALTISWLIFLATPLAFVVFVLTVAPLSLTSIYWAIALAGMTFTFFYDLVHLPLALYHKYREKKGGLSPKILPPVSFIVPAHNEEKCLARTLISLIELNYPDKEIIVVNDGSTDATQQIAERFTSRGITLVNQPNRGKAVAINTGLVYAKGKIIVTVDADSLIERSGLWSVISRFEDPKVMAVCGNVKVLNRVNLLTRCQALEYILDINLAKRAFDLFGSTMVVPGVFGAFRREVLERGGHFDIDTVTEDFDMTVKALKAGGVVQATSFAVSYTEAPEHLRDLYKQRLRWYRGTVQTFLKHRDVLNNPRFGLLSELGFPYIVLSMVFVPFAGLGALIAGLVAAFTGHLFKFLVLLCLFILLETLLALFSILLDQEDVRLLIYAPLFVIGFRQWRDAVKLKALFDVLLRRRFGWDKSRRLGRAEEIAQKQSRLDTK